MFQAWLEVHLLAAEALSCCCYCARHRAKFLLGELRLLLAAVLAVILIFVVVNKSSSG